MFNAGESRPRSGRLVLAAAIGLLLATGCASPPVGTCWRFEWSLEVEERFLDPTAASLVTLPTQLEGNETWWVTPSALVIESRGVLPSGEEGHAKTWIMPDRGRVYVFDKRAGVARAIPIALWNEERQRRSRLNMIETHRQLATEGGSKRYQRFAGGLGLDGKNGDYLLAALPGQLWRLRGGAPSPGWQLPLVPLAFGGVSRELAPRLSRVLDQIAPRTVEVMILPTGDRGYFWRRELDDTFRVDENLAFADLPRDLLDELDSNDAEYQEFWVLWRLWTEPVRRPLDMTLRGVRVRLEEVVRPAHLAQIEERIDDTEDLPELEELFHLVYAIDADRLLARLDRAADQGALADVMAISSVFSLRAPELLLPRIDGFLAKDALWEPYTGTQVREAQSWFRGVKEWIERGR